MGKAKITQKSPILENLETGKSYFWCACGRSKKQPFCDGSHTGTVFLPLKYKATKSEKIFFCCCKQTNKPPFCDGTHKNI